MANKFVIEAHYGPRDDRWTARLDVRSMRVAITRGRRPVASGQWTESGFTGPSTRVVPPAERDHLALKLSRKLARRPGETWTTLPAPWDALAAALGGVNALAQACGCYYGTVGRWARGQRAPSAVMRRHINSLARAHGVPMPWPDEEDA